MVLAIVLLQDLHLSRFKIYAQILCTSGKHLNFFESPIMFSLEDTLALKLEKEPQYLVKKHKRNCKTEGLNAFLRHSYTISRLWVIDFKPIFSSQALKLLLIFTWFIQNYLANLSSFVNEIRSWVSYIVNYDEHNPKLCICCIYCAYTKAMMDSALLYDKVFTKFNISIIF